MYRHESLETEGGHCIKKSKEGNVGCFSKNNISDCGHSSKNCNLRRALFQRTNVSKLVERKDMHYAIKRRGDYKMVTKTLKDFPEENGVKGLSEIETDEDMYALVNRFVEKVRKVTYKYYIVVRKQRQCFINAFDYMTNGKQGMKVGEDKLKEVLR